VINIRKIFSADFLKSFTNVYYRRGVLLAWIALIIPLIITYAGWRIANNDDKNDARVSFDFKIRETNQTILKRMHAYEQVLLGGIGLLASSDTVTRGEWKTYVENLLIDKNFPGILGIGYSYSLKYSDSLKLVRAMQREGFSNFRIWPEGKREEYTSVIYIEPFNERNQRAFGYDLLSEPLRKSAMLEARDNGLTTITGKITLVQETEYNIQAGFLIFIPFYKKNIQAPTIEQRRELFKGYVYSPFRMSHLMRTTLGNDLSNINIKIYDGLDTIPKNLMYNSDSLYNSAPDESFTGTSILNLYGKTWTLKFIALPKFIASFESDRPIIVLLSGILISLLFSLVTISFMNSKKTSKKLSEVLEATEEGIFGVDNSLKCTFINSSALQMLGFSMHECLNKNMHEFIHCLEVDGKICNVNQCPLIKTIKNGRTNSTSEVTLERKDKTSFPIEYSSHPIIENGIVTGTVVTFKDITERKKALAQIEGSLREKEVLLREIHHRVKNNLQIISSLLNLQAGFTDDKKTNEILEESKNRVKSMALIHEKLYQSKNFSSIDIHEFSGELIKNLFHSFGIESSAVITELSIDNINLNADQAVYLGLLVNELVSNSLKHAFKSASPNDDGEPQKKIFIGVKQDPNDGYSIKIGDNGCGFPDNINFKNTESLGLQLVMSLVKQLDGEISMNNNSGTEFSIKFRKYA
jgi:PAS domain S-box-containing protein